MAVKSGKSVSHAVLALLALLLVGSSYWRAKTVGLLPIVEALRLQLQQAVRVR